MELSDASNVINQGSLIPKAHLEDVGATGNIFYKHAPDCHKLNHKRMSNEIMGNTVMVQIRYVG